MKKLTKPSASVALLLITLACVPMISGCFSPAQIHEGFVLAESGLDSTVRILGPTNPALAEKIKLARPLVDAADNALAVYFAGKNQTNADKAQSALAALSAALDDIYTIAGVDPKILAVVEAFIAVANTWIIVSQGHLPPAPPSAKTQTRVSGGRTLPTVPGAKSAKDLRKYFNDRVTAAGHTEGVI